MFCLRFRVIMLNRRIAGPVHDPEKCAAVFRRGSCSSTGRRAVRHLLRQSPMRLRLTALFLTLLMSAAHAAPAPAPAQVEIPLSSGVLHAQLFKPEGEGPFPTVIALHGCGGLGSHSDSVQARYRDW